MTVSTLSETPDGGALRDEIARRLRRRAVMPLVAIGLALLYLVYAWFAFDVSKSIRNTDVEKVAILGLDSVAHKVHVTKGLRGRNAGEIVVAVEGERTSTWDVPPGWVELDGTDAVVDLGGGYLVRIVETAVEFTVPDYGVIRTGIVDDLIVTELPGPAPGWLRATDAKFDARPSIGRRVQLSRSKIEIHRYYGGWENFFFEFDSPFSGLSFGEVIGAAFSSDRVDPTRPNWMTMIDEIWTNADWQHGQVAIALWETLLMAVLGTMTAAIVGLPLALLAASNFTPSRILRFAVRRVFDFLRGIDNLIWSLIFIRAFGLGPLTGSLAIAFTDTGTLGKLFSEALENIDDRQVEGVRSTGSGAFLAFRFGVIPQILPLFVSQTLYYLESNTRSATVIGALGAGGIGLLLVQTIGTSRDWENTLYIILLTVILVFIMDGVSGWLRARLIGREAV